MNEKFTHIDLFSGIGGFALAAKWCGIRTVAFCECDRYCQSVLQRNFNAEVVADTKGLRGGPSTNGAKREGTSTSGQPISIYPNVQTFPAEEYAGAFILTAGFPCQPCSVAGKKKGKKDDRWIWPTVPPIIKIARPTWFLGENVPGIITMELDGVLADLEAIGYACQTFVIPACATDAKHRRDRVWIVGHAERVEWGQSSAKGRRQMLDGKILENGVRKEMPNKIDRSSKNVAHTARERTLSTEQSRQRNGIESGGKTIPNPTGRKEQRRAKRTQEEHEGSECYYEWPPEPGVGRVANGIPCRVDRLRALGNAIVPQVATEIMRAIMKVENDC